MIAAPCPTPQADLWVGVLEGQAQGEFTAALRDGFMKNGKIPAEVAIDETVILLTLSFHHY